MGIEIIGKEGFAITTDMLIFSISNAQVDNCRKRSEKRFSILLVKRDKQPFKNKWCLPGGYVGINETMDEASERVLIKETNLHRVYKEQLYTFDNIQRDPRRRTISTAYIALIDKNKISDELDENAAWFNIQVIENEKQITVVLFNNNEEIKFVLKKTLQNKTTNKYDYTILNNDNIGFDHPLLIITGIMRLRHKIQDTDIVFNLLPKYFTLGELQQIYEAILDKKLLDPAFRRIIADKVEKTNEIIKTGGHRPSILYKYK